MYFPKSQIKPNLYTNGGEYLLAPTKQDYKGYYYEVSSGQRFTGKTPQDGPNILLLPVKQEENQFIASSNLPPNFPIILADDESENNIDKIPIDKVKHFIQKLLIQFTINIFEYNKDKKNYKKDNQDKTSNYIIESKQMEMEINFNKEKKVNFNLNFNDSEDSYISNKDEEINYLRNIKSNKFLEKFAEELSEEDFAEELSECDLPQITELEYNTINFINKHIENKIDMYYNYNNYDLFITWEEFKKLFLEYKSHIEYNDDNEEIPKKNTSYFSFLSTCY